MIYVNSIVHFVVILDKKRLLCMCDLFDLIFSGRMNLPRRIVYDTGVCDDVCDDVCDSVICICDVCDVYYVCVW